MVKMATVPLNRDCGTEPKWLNVGISLAAIMIGVVQS